MTTYHNIPFCDKCGKPKWAIDSTISLNICSCLNDIADGISKVIDEGWVCPVCHRVFSPKIIECPYSPHSFTYGGKQDDS